MESLVIDSWKWREQRRGILNFDHPSGLTDHRYL